MELVRFFSWVLKIALALALLGELKSCTLTMMGLAAKSTDTGIMSYSKFSHTLTK